MKTVICLTKGALHSLIELDDTGMQPWAVLSGEQIGSNGTKRWGYNASTGKLTLFEYFSTSASMPAYLNDIASFPPATGSSGWGIVSGAPNPAFRGTVRWSLRPYQVLMVTMAQMRWATKHPRAARW